MSELSKEVEAPSGAAEELWKFMESFIGPTGGWLVSPKKFHAALVEFATARMGQLRSQIAAVSEPSLYASPLQDVKDFLTCLSTCCRIIDKDRRERARNFWRNTADDAAKNAQIVDDFLNRERLEMHVKCAAPIHKMIRGE